jgi:UDP-N-acetylglucosamine 2-epimerase
MKIIKSLKKTHQDVIIKKSLGFKNYFNLIPHAEFIIGNSSSGIIEVPFFKKPTIDIGRRQLGRFKHPSVISCDYKISSIKKAVKKALSIKFKNKIKKMKYLFQRGVATNKFIAVLKKTS